MRATVLIDNISNCQLHAEWGLSIYIEYEGHRLLLDTGEGEQFAQNAAERTKNLSVVPKEEQTQAETKNFTYSLPTSLVNGKRYNFWLNCFLMPWVPEAADPAAAPVETPPPPAE